MADALVTVPCPYCGHVNNLRVDLSMSIRPQVVLCDCDTGGCDQYFAASVRVDAFARGHRIDGLGLPRRVEIEP